MTKRRNAKRTTGPTRKRTSPRKRVRQDLRAFKARLRRMVDETRVVWEGEPFDSEYKFALSPQLVEFIVSLINESFNLPANAAEIDALEVAESIKAALS